MADVNKGAAPVDFDTIAGQVRLLVGDTDPKPLDPVQDGYGEYAWFSDDELEALVPLSRNSVKRTAIYVRSLVAVNQALQLKKWTTEDLAVDGPAIAKGIEATLKRLQADVDAEDQAALASDEFFGIYYPTQAVDYYRGLPQQTHPWGW